MRTRSTYTWEPLVLAFTFSFHPVFPAFFSDDSITLRSEPSSHYSTLTLSCRSHHTTHGAGRAPWPQLRSSPASSGAAQACLLCCRSLAAPLFAHRSGCLPVPPAVRPSCGAPASKVDLAHGQITWDGSKAATAAGCWCSGTCLIPGILPCCCGKKRKSPACTRNQCQQTAAARLSPPPQAGSGRRS